MICLLHVCKDLFCLSNIFSLTRFVTTRQQQDDFLSSEGIIDSQTTGKEAPQFKQLLSKLFKVAKITIFQSGKASQELLLDCEILQLPKPFVKSFSAGDFVFHNANVFRRRQTVKKYSLHSPTLGVAEGYNVLVSRTGPLKNDSKT